MRIQQKSRRRLWLAIGVIVAASAVIGYLNAGSSDAKGTASVASGSGFQQSFAQETDPAKSTALAKAQLKGKVGIFVPIIANIPLVQTWINSIRAQFQTQGMTLKVLDPNFDATKQLQLIRAAIAQKPAVLFVQNSDISSTASLLAQAEAKGIYVVQVNLSSVQNTDIAVVHNALEVAIRNGRLIAQRCSGKSIYFVVGNRANPDDVNYVRGFKKAFAGKSINMILSPDTGYDPNKAFDVTQSALQAHPDLCGVVGDYDVPTLGAAKAVKAAHLQAKIPVWTFDGSDAFCTGIKNGTFQPSWGSFGFMGGAVAANAAQYLIESGLKPGSVRSQTFLPIALITKKNLNMPYECSG